MPKQMKMFGYPEQQGVFTGEWEPFDTGSPSKRKRFRVPVYSLPDGTRIMDMMQMEKSDGK